MIRLNGDNLRISTVIFIIAYSIMPFISVAVSTYLTTYSYMVTSVLLLILIVMERKEESLNEVFANIIPFFAYGILTYFTNTDDIVLWGYKLLVFIMPVIVGAYIMQYHKDECKNYSKTIILCIMITCITTTLGLEEHPNISRWMATVQDSTDPRLVEYCWKNIGGYEFIYTMVLIYPLLVLAFKRGKISLFKAVLIASLVFSCLILAEYTIALILFFATTTLFFMKKDLKIRDVVIFLTVIIIFMFVFSGAISSALRSIANSVDSKNISSRLNDLAGGTVGLQKSEDKRLDLYMTSLNTFFKHPFGSFISGGWRSTGGHSFILDFLGQYGIFGLLTLIYIYRKIYYLFYYKYQKEEDYGYIVWIFSQAVLLSILNTGMWVNILSLYIPVVLCVLYGGDTNEENSLDSECAT